MRTRKLSFKYNNKLASKKPYSWLAYNDEPSSRGAYHRCLCLVWQDGNNTEHLFEISSKDIIRELKKGGMI